MRTSNPSTQNLKVLKQMIIGKKGCIVNVLLSWRHKLFPVIGRFGFKIPSHVLGLEFQKLTEPEDSLAGRDLT